MVGFNNAIFCIHGTALNNRKQIALYTVMSRLLNEFLFDVPDKIPTNARITINADLVREKLSGLAKNKDLSEYIL